MHYSSKNDKQLRPIPHGEPVCLRLPAKQNGLAQRLLYGVMSYDDDNNKIVRFVV